MNDNLFIESTARVVFKDNDHSGIVEVDAIWVKSHNSDSIEHTIRTESGSLNPEGVKIQTQAFVLGLTSAIHEAHKRGVWDSAEHFRYILAELEKGFVRVSEISHHPLSEFGS